MPTRKTIFDFRRWPLYMPTYEKLYSRFGYDIMNYFSLLMHFSIFYVIVFAASIILQVSYTMNDKFTSIAFDSNYNVIFSSIPFDNVRGFIWTGVLLVSIVFVRYLYY